MKRNDTARMLYKTMFEVRDLILENSDIKNPVELQKTMAGVIRKYRESIHRIDSRRADPLAAPITEAFRTRYDDDGGRVEYGILPEDGTETTDEEIREYLHDCVALPHINSPYDCTGQPFTRWIDYKRTPAGIVVIHSIGLDI